MNGSSILAFMSPFHHCSTVFCLYMAWGSHTSGSEPPCLSVKLCSHGFENARSSDHFQLKVHVNASRASAFNIRTFTHHYANFKTIFRLCVQNTQPLNAKLLDLVVSFSKHGSGNRWTMDHDREMNNCGLSPTGRLNQNSLPTPTASPTFTSPSGEIWKKPSSNPHVTTP